MTKSQSWTDNLQQRPQLQHQSPVSQQVMPNRGASVSATTSPINHPTPNLSLGMKKSSHSEYSLVSITKQKKQSLPKPIVDPDSLIDLSEDIRASQLTKVSVLEAFDPLLGDFDDDLLVSSTPRKPGLHGREDRPDATSNQG